MLWVGRIKAALFSHMVLYCDTSSLIDWQFNWTTLDVGKSVECSELIDIDTKFLA